MFELEICATGEYAYTSSSNACSSGPRLSLLRLPVSKSAKNSRKRGVLLTWNETRQDRLGQAVHHPGCCATLGMTSEPFLSNDRAGIALRTTEMSELRVESGALILVVGNS